MTFHWILRHFGLLKTLVAIIFQLVTIQFPATLEEPSLELRVRLVLATQDTYPLTVGIEDFTFEATTSMANSVRVGVLVGMLLPPSADEPAEPAAFAYPLAEKDIVAVIVDTKMTAQVP